MKARWLRCVLLALPLGGAVLPADAPAEEDGAEVTLKTQLEKGLRARLPSEFRFIAHVVDLVERGRLERPVVDRTFLWARRKPKNRVQYFKRALRIVAGRKGVME